MAAAIHELLADRGAAQRMATKARDFVEQQHSLELMVRKVEEVYRRVLGG
jgi:hypothetical protein